MVVVVVVVSRDRVRWFGIPRTRGVGLGVDRVGRLEGMKGGGRRRCGALWFLVFGLGSGF